MINFVFFSASSCVSKILFLTVMALNVIFFSFGLYLNLYFLLRSSKSVFAALLLPKNSIWS